MGNAGCWPEDHHYMLMISWWKLKWYFYKNWIKFFTWDTTIWIWTFTHVAYVKEWTKIKLYINWIKDISYEIWIWGSTGNNYDLKIGWACNTSWFNWYIDELRFSKWIARWTENFTPPSVEYNTKPTLTNVTITWSKLIWEVLSWTHTFIDSENDNQWNSIYRWYNSDSSTWANAEAIDNATWINYTLKLWDKYVFLKVTPVSNNTPYAWNSIMSNIITANYPPSGTWLTILWNTNMWENLTSTYSLLYMEGWKTEGTSLFQWYRSDTANWTWTAITWAISNQYTLTWADYHKYIYYELTPVSNTYPNTWATVKSAAIKEDTMWNDEYTVFLLQSDHTNWNSDFNDIWNWRSQDRIFTNNWNTIHSSDQKKFWNTSIYFDQSSSLDVDEGFTNIDWQFWSEDFTLDMWVYDKWIKHWGFISSDSWYIWKGWWGDELSFWSTDIQWVWWFDYQDQWANIAAVRSGTNAYIFVNWKIFASWSTVTWNIITDMHIAIGKRFARRDDYQYFWYLDEIRISKWIARWTSDFNVPSWSYKQLPSAT